VAQTLAEQIADGESITTHDQAGSWIVWAAAILTVAVVVATVGAAAARHLWVGDLAVHFRLQYAALMLLAFLVFVAVQRPGWAAVALGALLVNSLSAAPALASHPALSHIAADAIPVRVAAVNVLYSNREYGRVVDFVRREHPDIVSLVEVNARWEHGLAPLARDYPYRYQTHGSHGTGVLLLSRLPIATAAVLPLPDALEPAIEATLLVRGRPLRVFAIHASWPMSPWSARARDRQLVRIAELARAKSGALVVLGDLNITPFSPHFQQLLVDAHLTSTAHGFGWQPTWPAFMLPTGIQIDHALVTSDISVMSFRRGPYDGSDHRPIVVDLSL
jgi:endonuclease/exonuclease/phosphatase (EEP) superfamily protein YafD